MQYRPADPPTVAAEGSGIVPVLTRNRKMLIVGAIAIAAFGYFAFTALLSATSFYMTVDELVAEGAAVEGKSVRIVGSLVPFSFQRQGEESLLANFRLESGGQQVEARFDGFLDDLFFNPHSEITLSGTLGTDGVFLAEVYNIKCPSKYESLDVENPYNPVPVAEL